MRNTNSMGESSQPSSDQAHFSLRPYLLIPLKKRWLIFIVFMAVVILTTAYSVLQTPLYLSSAILDVHRLTFNIVPQVVAESQGSQRGDTFLQNQYTLLKSKTLANIVVRKLNLRPQDLLPAKKRAHDPVNRSQVPSQEDWDRLAQAVVRMLTVTQMKSTTFFQIDFLTPDPKLSMLLANTWGDEFVAYSAYSQLQLKDDIQKLVSNQVRVLQADIQEKQRQLEEIGLQGQVVNIDKDHPIDLHALEELTNALTQAKQDLIEKRVQYDRLLQRNYQAIPEITQSTEINQLKGQYGDLQRQYAEKSRMYQADYPEMVRLNSQMAQIQQHMNEETNDLYNKALANAKANFEQVLRTETALEAQIEKTKRETVEGRKESVYYEQLQVELEKKKKVLEGLLTKQSETYVSSDLDQGTAAIRVLQRAQMPQGVFSPKISRNISFSILMGLLAGLLLAFVSDFFDSTLRNSDDVLHRLNLPLMGVIPKHQPGELKPTIRFFHHDNNNRKGGDLVLLQNPASVASEALRTVRTSFLFNLSPRNFVITSTRSEEGKTFVAANLAISLAQLGRRVVLVDADMRNPRQHKVWKIVNQPGLGRFLCKEAAYPDIVRSSGVEGLSLIPSDSRVSNPAELLSSKRFDELLNILNDSFDHVILDSPPVLPVSDSIILANKCGHVILVVRGGLTPRDMVDMAVNRLAQTEAVLLGVVLNCIDLSDPYNYYSYYANKEYVYGYTKQTNKVH